MLVGGKPTAGGRLRRSAATGCERRRPKGGGSPEASPDGLGRGGQDPKKGFFLGPRRRSEATTEGGDGRRGETRMPSNASRVPDHPPYFLIAYMRITKTSALAWLQTI